MQAVFDHALGFRTGVVQAEQHVAEGQHFDHVGRGDLAVQRHPHTTTTLQRDVGAAVAGVGYVQVGLCHQLLDVAAARADFAQGVAGGAGAAVVGGAHTPGHPARAELGGHGGHQALAEHIDLVLEGFQRGGGRGIGAGHPQEAAGGHVGEDGGLLLGGGGFATHGEVVADEHMGCAGALGHVAVGVEGHFQLTHHLAVFPGLHQADLLAVLVGELGGVGTGGRTYAIGRHRVGAEQGVRVAAHHHVHAAELGDHGLVVVVADVAHHDDLVDTLGAQGIDLALGGDGFVLEGGVGVGAGRCLGLVGDGEAHDADGLAVAQHGDGLVHITRRLGRCQGRAGAEVDVGAEHGGLAAAFVQQVDEAFQAAVALVELMVAQGEGVEAHGVHHRGIGLAVGTGAVEIQRARLGITRVQLEHVFGRCGEAVDGGCHARKTGRIHGHGAGSSAGGGLELQGLALAVQVGVVVVDVQDGEVHRLRAVAPATGGQQGGGGRQGDAGGGAFCDCSHGSSPHGMQRAPWWKPVVKPA